MENELTDGRGRAGLVATSLCSTFGIESQTTNRVNPIGLTQSHEQTPNKFVQKMQPG